jgi:Leucine-rich repeat (LRR) protein
MTNLQKWLDSKYTTQAEKEQVKEIRGERKDIEGGELDLRAYKNLKEVIINCHSLKSPLTKLELGRHPNLTRLNMESNQLANLNVSGCPELVHFSASFNELKSVGFLKQLPNPEKLKSLNIARNNFASTTLDFLSQFTNLKSLTLGTKKKKLSKEFITVSMVHSNL